jgi:hypothetical protein
MSTATAPVVTPSPVTIVPNVYVDALALRKSGELDTMDILHLLKDGEITQEECVSLMDTVKAKRITTPIGNKLSAAVSPKGAVSVYGLGRWPVTLYVEQLVKLLDEEVVVKLLQFAADHRSELTVRPPKTA